MAVIICSKKTQDLIRDIEFKNNRRLSLLDDIDFLKERIKSNNRLKKKALKKNFKIQRTIHDIVNSSLNFNSISNMEELENHNNKIDKLRKIVEIFDKKIYIACKTINIFSSILEDKTKEYEDLIKID